MRLPIRVRLTVWYGSLLVGVIVVLSAFLVLQLRHDLRQALDEEIRLGAIELTRAVAEEASPDDSPHAAGGAAEVDDAADDFRDAARAILSPSAAGAQLLDPKGQVLVRYGLVADDGPLVGTALRSEALDEQPQTLTRSYGSQAYRVHLSAVRAAEGDRVLVVAESLRPVEKAVGRVVGLLLLAVPAAVAASSILAYWLAARALRPVDRMTRDAEEIGIAQLHERIAVPMSQDETHRLAVTLNAMLERIETGVRDKRRLVADASHELRTPLAIMRSELDVALRSRDVTAAQREVLLSVRDEVDRVTTIVDNIVTLAQADEGRLELLSTTVDIRELVEDVTARLQPLAEAKGLTLVVGDGSWRAQADAARLRLLVTNLMDNAIKFTPEGGSVTVEPWRSTGEVGLTVTDDAPQIPASDQARVFERFYRAEEARAGGAAGGGLGLAICQEVALAHGGRIWLEAATRGGNSFSVALPAWRAEGDAERHLPPASSSRGAEAGASSPAARHGDG